MKSVTQISLTQTAAAIGSAAIGHSKARIQASNVNNGTMYVGDVTAQNYELAKGESVELEGAISAVYLKSSAASGDKANVLLLD